MNEVGSEVIVNCTLDIACLNQKGRVATVKIRSIRGKKVKTCTGSTLLVFRRRCGLRFFIKHSGLLREARRPQIMDSVSKLVAPFRPCHPCSHRLYVTHSRIHNTLSSFPSILHKLHCSVPPGVSLADCARLREDDACRASVEAQLNIIQKKHLLIKESAMVRTTCQFE